MKLSGGSNPDYTKMFLQWEITVQHVKGWEKKWLF